MKASKWLAPQPLKARSSKQERERSVLLGLVDYYIKTAKPVGSDTLKDAGFPNLSSATIRNYFQHLEEAGYLAQHHTSSGRIPTAKAFRLYAQELLDERQKNIKRVDFSSFDSIPNDMKEVALYMQRMAEAVSETACCASFLSSPRFDQDFIIEMRLVGFDAGRCLVALLTNFGVIHTEVLQAPRKLTQHEVRKIESYLRYRLNNGATPPDEMTVEESEIGHRFFQEAMARYLVSYTNFSQEDLFRSGISKLLRYPEFQDAESLTSSLAIFENSQALRALMRDTVRSQRLKFWIGEDLLTFLSSVPNCAVISVPYRIGPKNVGAIGLIGPMRMPYGELFQLLSQAADALSKYLTDNLYKHRISFRSSLPVPLTLDFQERGLLPLKEERALIEDKNNKTKKK